MWYLAIDFIRTVNWRLEQNVHRTYEYLGIIHANILTANTSEQLQMELLVACSSFWILMRSWGLCMRVCSLAKGALLVCLLRCKVAMVTTR